MNTQQPQPLAALPEGRFSGREAFATLIRQALDHAARTQAPKLVFCDPNFADWPLNETGVIDSLQAWASSRRKLLMLARDYDGLRRAAARFVRWRVVWDHLIECRRVPNLGDEFPSLLLLPQWGAQRLDVLRCQGSSSSLPEQRVGWQLQIQELYRQSAAGFPATIAGL